MLITVKAEDLRYPYDAIMLSRGPILVDVFGDPKELLRQMQLITPIQQPNLSGMNKPTVKEFLETLRESIEPLVITYAKAPDTMQLLKVVARRGSPVLRLKYKQQ